MKKLLLIPILFLITLSQVNAQELLDVNITDECINDVCTTQNLTNWYNSHSSDLITAVSYYLDYYNTNYVTTYPYYRIGISPSSESFNIWFYASSELPTLNSNNDTLLPYNLISNNYYIFGQGFQNNHSWYTITNSSPFYTSNQRISSYQLQYFFSNFDLRFSNITLSNIDTIGYTFMNHSWSSYSNIVPTLYDTLELDFLSDYDTNTYTTVNLNDYEYIILSFKDYNNLISPIQLDYIGQPCLTQVNGYGTIDRNSTNRCYVNSSSWTKTRIYPDSSTLQNKGVYYLIPYNINQENKVKINTRVFNINYITSANSNNPTVDVNGRSYPAIPYSNLGNSTTDNEDNNYIPGESIPIWDTTTDSDFWSNLFEHPMLALQNVWTAITTMFALIGSFIGLLPQTLQSFLIASFSMGIVLGLLKIIL